MNERLNTKESKLLHDESVSLETQMKYGYLEMAKLNKQITKEMDYLEAVALYITEEWLKRESIK